MRRAIAKQSPVRTIGNRRLPPKRSREGRARPGVRAVPITPSGTAARRESRTPLGEPAAALFVPKDNGVLP
jgi:hypothetical protein